MNDLFISDLHLTPDRPDITDAFFAFLDREIPGTDRFFILGDFFEVWLGDDDDTAFNHQIIDRLAELQVERFFMHGNRDFLIGESFCRKTGFELLSDPTVIECGGLQTLLLHGDSLCTLDTEYMKVRAMLRNPAVQQDLLSKSLEERAAIATGARDQSRAHTRETAEDIMDVTPAEVVNMLELHQCELMIHGHTHRPARHSLTASGQPASRIVLGDWDQQGWLLRVDEGRSELASFPIITG